MRLCVFSNFHFFNASIFSRFFLLFRRKNWSTNYGTSLLFWTLNNIVCPSWKFEFNVQRKIFFCFISKLLSLLSVPIITQTNFCLLHDAFGGAVNVPILLIYTNESIIKILLFSYLYLSAVLRNSEIRIQRINVQFSG